ncbi:hypothetical protein [Halioxenophilus aromaticivorans]|uniref:Exonuclease domain-containing protein n=1 Tax=Halioxenophilus aromaticivorans TaxID=1306992 RepID=A0AAV3U0F2_9ALTE
MLRAPAIIDIEASGFGPESYPIEIGAVLPDGRRFSSLITPFPEWCYWSDEAQAVHNISRQLLAEGGKSGVEVAHCLNAFLGSCQAYSDGWVVDKPWLDKLFYHARIRPTFTLSPIEALMPEAQINCWDNTKAQVIEQLQVDRHRASTDALVIQQTFLRSKQLAATG